MKYFLTAVTVLFFACNTTKHAATSPEAAMPKNISLNGKLFTALFEQRAAEYRALCLQGYNAARMRIDTYAAQSSKPKAMITDIDETILDNSAYAVHQAWQGKEYIVPDWYDWTDRAAADTMPGAAAFLKYAQSKNVEIFYVTNRETRERPGTLRNLQRFNLPYADESHLLTRRTGSSKEDRRMEVMQSHEVILLMGDNLADFSTLFDKKIEEERRANVDALSSEFGRKFIFFPNPNYGDWETSLYKYNYKLTQPQKDSVLRSVLKTY